MSTSTLLLGWLLTFLLHSGLLLLLAWALDHTLAPAGVRSVAVREWTWRIAIWLPMASATLVTVWRADAVVEPRSPVVVLPQSEEAVPAFSYVVPGSLRTAPVAEPQESVVRQAPVAEPTRFAAPSPQLAATPVAAPMFELQGGWLRALLLLWLLPATWLLLRLLHQWHRVRRQTHHLPRVLDPAWLALTAELTPRRPVLLRADTTGTSPLAGPGLQIVLPGWVLALDCALERRTLLAHELQHIDRGDPRWRLWHETLAALLWPQLLLRLAIIRLEALAELDCDARATTGAGCARALARSLLTCADHLRKHLTLAASQWPVPTALQPAMATARSPLGERLHHLLDPAAESTAMTIRSTHPLRTRLLKLAAATFTLTGATLLLPAIGVSQAAAPMPRVASEIAALPAGSAAPMPRIQPAIAALPAGSAAPLPRIEPAIAAQPAGATAPAPRAEPALAAVMPGRAAMPAVAAVAAAGSSVQVQTSSEDGYRINMSRNEDEDGTRIKIELGEGRRALEARFNGKPQFNDAGDTLVSLRGGDDAWIDDQRSSPRRRVDFQQSASGLELRYRVNGREQALDDAGRRWLSATILELVRETALDVEQRVARLLAVGGAQAVLDEVDRIRASHARGSYLRQLARNATLSDAEQVRFLAVSRKLNGDYERRQALLALLERQDLGPAQQARVLAATDGIDSDYEKRQILAAMAERMDLNDAAVRAAWRQTMLDLGSSYERRQAIEGLTQREDLDDAALAVVLDAIAEIGSDYEQRVSLQGLAPRLAKTGALAARYAEATRRIGSDYEQRQALSALLESGSESKDLWPALLEATSHIGSDYERRVLMEEIANRMPDDDALIARYRQLATELGDYERGRAERALLDKVL